MNRNILRGVAALAIGLLALGAGCKRSGGEAGGAGSAKVKVFAAAGLHAMLDELTPAGNDALKPASLSIDYGGTGHLLGKLATLSAPELRPDVFIAAEQSFADKAVARKLVDRTEVIGYNVPVIVVNNDSKADIQSVADLGKEGVRLALGSNEGPAIGVVSDELLKGAGLDRLLTRGLPRLATVEDVANTVKLGHADAGIVWEMTATQPANAGKMRMIAIPNAPRVAIVACRVTQCPHPAQADAYIKFLANSELARSAMARYHIVPTSRPE